MTSPPTSRLTSACVRVDRRVGAGADEHVPPAAVAPEQRRRPAPRTSPAAGRASRRRSRAGPARRPAPPAPRPRPASAPPASGCARRGRRARRRSRRRRRRRRGRAGSRPRRSSSWWYGGVKNQLASRNPPSTATTAGSAPPTRATTIASTRYSSSTLVSPNVSRVWAKASVMSGSPTTTSDPAPQLAARRQRREHRLDDRQAPVARPSPAVGRAGDHVHVDRPGQPDDAVDHRAAEQLAPA